MSNSCTAVLLVVSNIPKEADLEKWSSFLGNISWLWENRSCIIVQFADHYPLMPDHIRPGAGLLFPTKHQEGSSKWLEVLSYFFRAFPTGKLFSFSPLRPMETCHISAFFKPLSQMFLGHGTFEKSSMKNISMLYDQNATRSLFKAFWGVSPWKHSRVIFPNRVIVTKLIG